MRGRILSPLFYLRAVIVLASGALIALPLGADAVNLALHPVTTEGGDCRILSVIDGDTLSMWCPEGGARRVRLEGFDAPELFSPRCLSELVAAQTAGWALRGHIFAAERIEARFDGSDRYGRDLAQLTLDGVPLARTMIAAGHGRAYEGERRRGWCAPA